MLLVDPRQVQRAPNRPKTDVHDCQWIQRLHSLGLLTAAFRPEEPIRVWRAYQRHRATLIEDAGRHLQRIEKALEQMNVKLPEVVSDITGVTGMGIVRAIVRGERDPKALAKLRDHRCKASAATIARALQGTWQPEHLFALQQSLALYDYYHEQIRDCDRVIEAHLQGHGVARGAPAGADAAGAPPQGQRGDVRRAATAAPRGGGGPDGHRGDRREHGAGGVERDRHRHEPVAE